MLYKQYMDFREKKKVNKQYPNAGTLPVVFVVRSAFPMGVHCASTSSFSMAAPTGWTANHGTAARSAWTANHGTAVSGT